MCERVREFGELAAEGGSLRAPEIGYSRGFCFKQRHSLCRDRKDAGSEWGRERETHLKTAPSVARHELSAMVKFMRRMQQQYVQQQRQQQQQQQLAVQQNQSAANTSPPHPRFSPLAPHGAQKRTSKADSGAAFYRTFL